MNVDDNDNNDDNKERNPTESPHGFIIQAMQLEAAQ
jgi:hypothetical protein